MAHHPARGAAAILLAATLWSMGGIGIKSLDLSPLAIAGWRSLFAVPLLLPFAFRRSRAALLRDPRVWGVILAYTSTLCFFVASTKLTTAANAILTQYTAPFWVMLYALRHPEERAGRREVVLVMLCFAGLGLFFLDRLSAQGLLGIGLGLIAGVAMGSLAYGLRRLGSGGDVGPAILAVLCGNLLAAAICSPWMIPSAATMSGKSWAILAALGVFQIGLPYVLFSSGVREVTALRATLLAMVEPLLNPVWVAIGTGEIPGWGTVAGGSLILGSLAIDALISRRPRVAVPE